MTLSVQPIGLTTPKQPQKPTWTNPFSAIGKGWIARLKTVTPFFTPVILATIWGFILKEQEKTNPDKPIFKFLDKYFGWAQ